MDPGALVIVHCQGPKEKLWGELLRLDAVGVVIRGLDLSSVDDWLAQEQGGGVRFIVASTLFVPMHRVERVYLDEGGEMTKSFADRFADAVGGDVREALRGGPGGEEEA